VWLQRTIAALGTHQNRRAAMTNAPLASDLHKLLRDRLRIEGPVVLVGHDIGLMIGYLMEQYERTSSIRPADGT
jgi:pimeloyl-ACP methyl ester carboxylesterase